MGSVDDRIKLFAETRQQEVAQSAARWLELIRHEIRSDIYNMVVRFGTRKPRTDRAAWLRNKSYDDTYRDHGPKSKQYRTKVRTEYFIDMCLGDEKLFLALCEQQLNVQFPIPGNRYSWRATLEKREDRLTVRYKYRLKPKEARDA